jgi:RNA polymerase sigma-70 factor (ECF subfamily)
LLDRFGAGVTLRAAGEGDGGVRTREEQQQASGLAPRLDERFRGPLMSFFLRRVRDRSEAEDLTHDVFVRLLAAAERDQIEDIDAFVFKVATNLLRDRGRRALRRNGARGIDPDLVSEITHELWEDRDPERVLLGRASLQEIIDALGELNERTRDIYILFRLESMKQREIAALYGISQSTVEKEVMRATLHLSLRTGRP